MTLQERLETLCQIARHYYRGADAEHTARRRSVANRAFARALHARRYDHKWRYDTHQEHMKAVTAALECARVGGIDSIGAEMDIDRAMVFELSLQYMRALESGLEFHLVHMDEYRAYDVTFRAE